MASTQLDYNVVQNNARQLDDDDRNYTKELVAFVFWYASLVAGVLGCCCFFCKRRKKLCCNLLTARPPPQQVHQQQRLQQEKADALSTEEAMVKHVMGETAKEEEEIEVQRVLEEEATNEVIEEVKEPDEDDDYWDDVM